MTNEQINRAIAETCGWKMQDHPDCVAKKVGWQMPEKWILRPDGMLVFKHDIPNYCECLNAMHEAEKTIVRNHNLWTNYFYYVGATIALHATSRQRAEAFLRTLGKWEEVQE